MFAALYHGDARPHSRWIRLIRTRLPSHQLGLRGTGLIDEVFEQLAGTYALDSLQGRMPNDLPVGAWLHRRFAWDARRAAEQIIRCGGEPGLLDVATSEDLRHRTSARPPDVLDEVTGLLLRERILALSVALPLKERRAVIARLASDMDSARAYDALGLLDGSRERANHNQAFASGVRKLRDALLSEGWADATRGACG